MATTTATSTIIGTSAKVDAGTSTAAPIRCCDWTCSTSATTLPTPPTTASTRHAIVRRLPFNVNPRLLTIQPASAPTA